MIRITTESDHDSLNSFYEKNGLEITEEEPVSTDALKSWRLYQDDIFAGACTLAFRQNEFIIDGIALDENARGGGLGTMLLRTAIEEVQSRGGNRVFLVARAPWFFEANGFYKVSRADAPEFFECFSCDQYGKTCFPEIMRIDLETEAAD